MFVKLFETPNLKNKPEFKMFLDLSGRMDLSDFLKKRHRNQEGAKKFLEDMDLIPEDYLVLETVIYTDYFSKLQLTRINLFVNSQKKFLTIDDISKSLDIDVAEVNYFLEYLVKNGLIFAFQDNSKFYGKEWRGYILNEIMKRVLKRGRVLKEEFLKGVAEDFNGQPLEIENLVKTLIETGAIELSKDGLYYQFPNYIDKKSAEMAELLREKKKASIQELSQIMNLNEEDCLKVAKDGAIKFGLYIINDNLILSEEAKDNYIKEAINKLKEKGIISYESLVEEIGLSDGIIRESLKKMGDTVFFIEESSKIYHRDWFDGLKKKIFQILESGGNFNKDSLFAKVDMDKQIFEDLLNILINSNMVIKLSDGSLITLNQISRKVEDQLAKVIESSEGLPTVINHKELANSLVLPEKKVLELIEKYVKSKGYDIILNSKNNLSIIVSETFYEYLTEFLKKNSAYLPALAESFKIPGNGIEQIISNLEKSGKISRLDVGDPELYVDKDLFLNNPELKTILTYLKDGVPVELEAASKRFRVPDKKVLPLLVNLTRGDGILLRLSGGKIVSTKLKATCQICDHPITLTSNYYQCLQCFRFEDKNCYEASKAVGLTLCQFCRGELKEMPLTCSICNSKYYTLEESPKLARNPSRCPSCNVDLKIVRTFQ